MFQLSFAWRFSVTFSRVLIFTGILPAKWIPCLFYIYTRVCVCVCVCVSLSLSVYLCVCVCVWLMAYVVYMSALCLTCWPNHLMKPCVHSRLHSAAVCVSPAASPPTTHMSPTPLPARRTIMPLLIGNNWPWRGSRRGCCRKELHLPGVIWWSNNRPVSVTLWFNLLLPTWLPAFICCARNRAGNGSWAHEPNAEINVHIHELTSFCTADCEVVKQAGRSTVDSCGKFIDMINSFILCVRVCMCVWCMREA